MQLTRWEIQLLNPERLKGLINSGYTPKQIAKDTNSDVGTIYKRLKEYHIKFHKKHKKNCPP